MDLYQPNTRILALPFGISLDYYQKKLLCINGQFIDYDPAWYNNNGRIFAKFPLAIAPRTLAEAMIELINLTFSDVDKALKQ